ncbi:MAG: hypothetical protein HYV14_14740 [Elusimicrobia bacterium]|nr:hypothetical protein [Elusimicrobiota bacterium]
MKLSRLALAAALAVVWAALSPAIRAEDDGDRDEQTIEVRKRAHHDEREGAPRERHEGGPRERHERDPEMKAKLDKMRDLENKARELSIDWRDGTDAEKAVAKTELRKTLGELFDAKLSLETSMLARMEKHVAELKAKIAKKKSSREKAVETRLSRMTGDGDEW